MILLREKALLWLASGTTFNIRRVSWGATTISNRAYHMRCWRPCIILITWFIKLAIWGFGISQLLTRGISHFSYITIFLYFYNFSYVLKLCFNFYFLVVSSLLKFALVLSLSYLLLISIFTLSLLLAELLAIYKFAIIHKE